MIKLFHNLLFLMVWTSVMVPVLNGQLLAQPSPYFGQPAPGTIPVLFAPSIIPDGAYSISFTPDGLECMMTLMINNRNTIMTSKDENGNWPVPQIASFSGIYPDLESHIAPDGTRAYFGSWRPLPGASAGPLYQWYVEKTSSGWSNLNHMDPPLKDIFMMYPSVAANGNMYFTANEGDDYFISKSELVNGVYQQPERLSDSINHLLYSAHPFIALDESYLIFDAALDSAQTLVELFISYHKPDGSWTTAINLGDVINSGIHQGCPFVSRDGKYFFYYQSQIGHLVWVDASFIDTLNPIVGTRESQGNLTLSALKQNYPNPASRKTIIEFSLDTKENVRLTIFNCHGKRIRTLINEERMPGNYQMEIDITGLKPGIYFYSLSTQKKHISKQLVLY